MNITKLLLWISYIGFVLSIIGVGFLGFVLMKQDFNAQEAEKESLQGVLSKSITQKFNLPLNLNIEYYFRLNDGEVLVESYFLKIQKKLLNNATQAQHADDSFFPKQVSGSIYAMPDSESYLYHSIPYSSIKETITNWKVYVFLACGILLTAIFLTIRFLQNCDKGHFFVAENSTYIRMISYLAVGYSLINYGAQWVIFQGLNKNFEGLGPINLDLAIEFNWTFLLISLFMVLIAQAFTEGIKLKEEQSLTI